ncbi:hypothetical protein D9619_013396 [Psilocybe cf. subviscida]|uniref:Uncharacterized protein n=1 Tax=Psilocybe cf. subviscida TaxID=2480587 RepID=A0A8H5BRK0_9AGAR|nr:hypothetical protein D9619_013396 [Psilocybe cf. subviscida]
MPLIDQLDYSESCMVHKPADTFDFLELFPEIRENVYIEYALTPDSYIPLTPPERETKIRRPDDSALIYLSPTFESSRLTSLPLLLVNHQLHGEFAACLQRLAGSKTVCYEGIVEIIHERSIHPTWTLVPIMTRHVPVVYAQILISNSPGEHKGRSGWRGGVGGPGTMVWGLLSLLLSFVEGGLLLGWNKAPQGWKGTVDMLVLEVKTPEPVDGLVIKHTRRGGCGGRFIPRDMWRMRFPATWTGFYRRIAIRSTLGRGWALA